MASQVETVYKGQKYIISYVLSVSEGQIGNCGLKLIQRIAVNTIFIYKDSISASTLFYPKPLDSNPRVAFGLAPSSTHTKEEKEFANCIVSSARDKISELAFEQIFSAYLTFKNPQNLQFIITDGINGDRSTGNYVEYSNGYRTCDFMGWLLEGNAKDKVTAHPGPITWNYNHPNPELPSLVQCVIVTFNNAEVFRLTKNNSVEFTPVQRQYIENEYVKKYPVQFKDPAYLKIWASKFFTNLYHSGKED